MAQETSDNNKVSYTLSILRYNGTVTPYKALPEAKTCRAHFLSPYVTQHCFASPCLSLFHLCLVWFFLPLTVSLTVTVSLDLSHSRTEASRASAVTASTLAIDSKVQLCFGIATPHGYVRAIVPEAVKGGGLIVGACRYNNRKSADLTPVAHIRR